MFKECDECHEVFDCMEMVGLGYQWYCMPCNEKLDVEYQEEKERMHAEYYADRM